jgi:hypothetical protein
MPNYQFSIVLTTEQSIWGFANCPQRDIDRVWSEYERHAHLHYGSKLDKFLVGVLSKLSTEVPTWIEPRQEAGSTPSLQWEDPTKKRGLRTKDLSCEIGEKVGNWLPVTRFSKAPALPWAI